MKCIRLNEEIKACHYLRCQKAKKCMQKSFTDSTPPFKRASKLEPSPFKPKKGKK